MNALTLKTTKHCWKKPSKWKVISWYWIGTLSVKVPCSPKWSSDSTQSSSKCQLTFLSPQKIAATEIQLQFLFFWTPLHTTHCADRTWLERGNPWVGASKGNYGLPLGPFLNLDGLSHTASSETAAIWKRPNTLGGGRKPLRARPKHAFLIQFRLQQRRCFQMLNYF